jgi:iron uptake system EfeUOB component EfeO/EfeM
VLDTTDGASKYARKLLADVQTLKTRADTLELQPAQLANGAVDC